MTLQLFSACDKNTFTRYRSIGNSAKKSNSAVLKNQKKTKFVEVTKFSQFCDPYQRSRCKLKMLRHNTLIISLKQQEFLKNIHFRGFQWPK